MNSRSLESALFRNLSGASAILIALICQSCSGNPPSQESAGPSLLSSRGAKQSTADAPAQTETPAEAPPGPEQPARPPRGALFAQADEQAQQMQQQQQQQEQQPQQQQSSSPVTTETGLQYEEIVVGNGAVPRYGQTVTVHYTGWLTNGTKFDSSLDKGQPFQFVLGAREVIRGWDEGVSTMRIGGKRRLIVPPDLGYGDRGAGGVIPPGATLVFDVELLGAQ